MKSMLVLLSVSLAVISSSCHDVFAFHHHPTTTKILIHQPQAGSVVSSSLLQATTDHNSNSSNNNLSRRTVLGKTVSTVAASMGITSGLVGGGIATVATFQPVQPVQAVGPVKINLLNPTYTAIPCPKDRPIPGEKAMKGMRGLCVTVEVDLEDSPKDPLEKVGVYGYVTDKGTGESVLANNPDGGTDAGQFAMVEAITSENKKITFEFIAAVPSEQDLSGYDAGIAPIDFKSLRVVSFPGGQQYGAISPCEMNEFSSECEDWEAENGLYEKKEYMIKSNPRTKGR